MKWHAIFEKNVLILTVGILITVAIGGIVEIVPLYTIESTIENVDGVRPYSPLELAGRRIYIREGCYLCHSQMVRPFRDEVERYGHYSIAAESMFDHPFQWGSKRTGPDLARVGRKYTNDWHVAHLTNPQSLVPGSVMPQYPFLVETPLNIHDIAAHLEANVAVGVPYTEDMIAAAREDLMAQADPNADYSDLLGRYPGAQVGNLDGRPEVLTEMDALVAYLQVLGTMVDFSQYTTEDLRH